MPTTTDLPTLRVNEIGEYIRHQCCPRRFKLEIDGRKEARRLPFYERLFNPLDPVLQEEGRNRENQWASMLLEIGIRQIDPVGTEISWSDAANHLNQVGFDERIFLREVEVEGKIGAFNIKGRIDFLLIRWHEGHPILQIVEAKASRKDRTYHRIQVCLYRLLILQLIEDSPLEIAGNVITDKDVQAVVARIDEDTNTPQSILDLNPLSLDMEETDISSLLSQNGPLTRWASSNLEDLDYQLNQKCDGCVFNTDCLPETALKRKPQLLGISPNSVRTLKLNGITTIDDIADLDLESSVADNLRADPSFSEDLVTLRLKAKVRRLNTPGDSEPDVYQVQGIPNSGFGALPEYVLNGKRLIRIYLQVDYDYAENRIGALAAHITDSDKKTHTPFQKSSDETWSPYPRIVEIPDNWERTANSDDLDRLSDINGKNVIKYKSSPWIGRYIEDTSVERELIESFLNELIDAIDATANQNEVPIHFYVWSRSEIRHLVEGCSRVNSELLGHLRHLLGSRESLEQLIFSSIQDEVVNRYAYAWTGRGLSVISSLSWFGKGYHWKRNVGRSDIDLDRVFTQDIFDFKTRLDVTSGQWARGNEEESTKELFEIRSRFFDSLPAPYWRASWGTLPDTELIEDAKVRNAINRYNEAGRPNYLRSYLEARVHALRWIEEKIGKNREIDKIELDVDGLRIFRLQTRDLGDACTEFLRLDQHVSISDWLSLCIRPPRVRVSSYSALPITNISSTSSANRFTADIDTSSYGSSLSVLSENSSIQENSWVRLTPRPDPIERGQGVGLLLKYGTTCIINEIDWDSGTITFDQLQNRYSNRYQLSSVRINPDDQIYSHATLDESPSDFVSSKVDERLSSRLGDHVYQWFDPTDPDIPESIALEDSELQLLENFVNNVVDDKQLLNDVQGESIISGSHSKIQLLQGPPGTGKTRTTSIAILIRTILFSQPGDFVLLTGSTHTAVDTLVKQVANQLEIIKAIADELNISYGNINIVRVDGRDDEYPVPIQNLISRTSTPYVQLRAEGITILAGTTNAALKLGKTLHEAARFPTSNGTFLGALYVDEASMMKLPDFMAIATLVKQEATILLAGDHRQLSPIMSHDWEREDRPPTVLYKPFVSVYDAVLSIARSGRPLARKLVYSALSHSFRLPYEIRELISRIYELDDIELTGPNILNSVLANENTNPIEHIWDSDHGVFVLIHNEQSSRKSNKTESSIIEKITEDDRIADNSIAVITPHRAQRSLLNETLGTKPCIDLIDTVERLQGGERPNVIVSATASDPASISSSAEFLLNLNRANVAFSRAQKRLIVICSESILDHIPADIEHYQSAMLWKSLRDYCNNSLGKFDVGEYAVSVYEPSLPE